uniref:Late endosomal/lysosomal adaptor and MAPK and MTOR activator 5 n=1 Tax=Globodera pallida TaxID=36090 RepID=A0A183CED7_GLOPA
MSLEDGPEGELPQEEERDIEQPPTRTIRKSAKGQIEELAMAVMPARIMVSAEVIEGILGAMPTTTIMDAEGTTTGIAEGTETLSRRRRPDASITCAVAEIVPDRQRRGERVIVSSALGTAVSVLTVADRRRPISSWWKEVWNPKH